VAAPPHSAKELHELCGCDLLVHTTVLNVWMALRIVGAGDILYSDVPVSVDVEALVSTVDDEGTTDIHLALMKRRV